MLSINNSDHVTINIPQTSENYEITIKNITFSGFHLIPKIIKLLKKITGQTSFNVSINYLE